MKVTHKTHKGYSEETRVKIKDDIQLDATYYQGYTQEALDDMVKMVCLMMSN